MSKLELKNLSKLADVEVPKPLYAGAGAAGLAAQAVKGYVETLAASAKARRTAAGTRVVGYQKQVAGFEVKAFADRLQSRATAGAGLLTAEAKARREKVEERVGGLQADVRTLPAKVTSLYKVASSEALEAYDDLAKRGEVLVAKLRGEAAAAPVETPVAEAPVVEAPVVEAPVVETPVEKPAKKTAAKKAPAKKAAPEQATGDKATSEDA